MGLDMFLFQAEKPTQDAANRIIGLPVREIKDAGYEVFLDGEWDEEISELVPYCALVDVVREEIDLAAIKAHHGIVDTVECTGRCISSDGITYNFHHCNGNNTEVFITHEEIDSDFLIRSKTKAYITKLDRVTYWRKFYALDDYFHNYFEEILNCGYYKLSEDIIEGIRDYDDEFEVPDNIEGIFYWSWW